MDENLVGYLLDALESDERRAVEEHLRTHPEARVRLLRLRSLMQPLAADPGPVEVPADLWVRALGRVAEYSCRSLPAVPAAPTTPRPTIPIRSWWRRADVLVAACVLVCAALLVPPGLVYLRYEHTKLACQNNLRELDTALKDYSQRHGGYMPNVATFVTPPRNVAGLYVVMLQENGLPRGKAHVHCPPQDTAALPPSSRTEVENMAQGEFEHYVRQMAEECYAYSLGYRDRGGIPQSHRRDPLSPDSPYQAILADRPPNDVASGAKGNSPNHAGRGQNVLFLDGHCRFCTTRTVGVNEDDIYVNFDGKVAAGKCREDTVLGAGDARP